MKAPTPGEVKTRLRSVLSAEEAARLYRDLASDTLRTARRLRDVRVVVAYAANPQFPDCSWLGEDVRMFRQQGDDLGARLIHAFRWAFARNAHHVVAIGSDAPELSARWLRQAFQALARFDVVLGPTTDGGYHLIGLTRPQPNVFTDMPWSTDRLFANTLERIKRLGVSVRCLKPIADLDTPRDVQRYVATLDGRRPRTRTARDLINFAKSLTGVRDFVQRRVTSSRAERGTKQNL